MLAVDYGREAARITLGLLDDWFGGSAKSVGATLWDGSRWPDDGPRPAMLVLKHPGSMREMFMSGTELGLAEAYLHDHFDVEGDMESAFELYEALERSSPGLGGKIRALGRLRRLPACPPGRVGRECRARLRGFAHSRQRDAQAISHHYDVSNEFYSLWLDRRMVYSCAYFRSGDDTLYDAQEQKLDYVCRKLRLKPGQRLLDIGCGWGGLIMHAAERYGVDATGITLSRAQAELATQRIEAAGLSGRCRVRIQDYREVEEDKPFDALVSIGMFEHVGAGVLPVYFGKAYRLLRPGGVFLNHGISSRYGQKSSGKAGFIDTYVFPDGELVPVGETVRAAEAAGFEVRDVESLREHYTMTLRHWIKRLEEQREAAVGCTDERRYRIWRLYLAGSAHWFKTGRNNLHQTLLVRPAAGGGAGLPLTREDWY